MKERQKQHLEPSREKHPASPTPYRGRDLDPLQGRAVNSKLAVFKDRFTYTFLLDRQVSSVHFDRGKKEIFLRGHNIQNLKLTAGQIRVLKGLLLVLSGDEQGRHFLSDYAATLEGQLADKNLR